MKEKREERRDRNEGRMEMKAGRGRQAGSQEERASWRTDFCYEGTLKEEL